MEEVGTEKQPENRVNKPWQFQPGKSGNPAGRPKGKTMKEFAREYLMNKTDEEKLKWLKKQSDELIWRMAEGNPHVTTDVTTGGQRLTVSFDQSFKDKETHDEEGAGS